MKKLFLILFLLSCITAYSQSTVHRPVRYSGNGIGNVVPGTVQRALHTPPYTSQGGGTPSGPSNAILAENGDYIMTEDGNYIVQEAPPVRSFTYIIHPTVGFTLFTRPGNNTIYLEIDNDQFTGKGFVNWGDGTSDSVDFDAGYCSTPHHYDAGTYNIVFSFAGDITRIYFGSDNLYEYQVIATNLRWLVLITAQSSHFLTSIDITGYDSFQQLFIGDNKLTELEITTIINELPDRTGIASGYYIFVPQDEGYLQELTSEQLAILASKNWMPD